MKFEPSTMDDWICTTAHLCQFNSSTHFVISLLISSLTKLFHLRTHDACHVRADTGKCTVKVRDDAEGHLIYHKGDVVDSRCKFSMDGILKSIMQCCDCVWYVR